MKKRWIRLFVILLAIQAVSALFFISASAESKNTVLLFETVRQSDDELVVDVTVKENSGVYSMLLSLQYDTSALELVGLEYGSALQGLDPLHSGELSEYPFKISYLGTNKTNDTSTGKLMTLTFAVKEDAPDGDYTITFGYEKNKDVNHLQNGEIQAKNLLIGGVKITLKESEIEVAEPFEEPVDPANPDEGPNENAKDATVWIIVGSVAAGGAVVTIGAVLTVRKKKRKLVRSR